MDNRKILALGFFDGVHLGHGALLKACRALADSMSLPAAAVTFTSHPEALITGSAPGLINTQTDRVTLLQTLYGMDEVILLPFDREMMSRSWQDFFHRLLTVHHAAGLVCGHDFHFGNRGAGTPELLESACAEAGIPCIIVPEQKINGITVSSTCIRTFLENGEMEKAVSFLGHPHILTGQVVPGRQVGRTIGIPTANLLLPEGLLCPRHGVYACKAVFDGQQYYAVTNIGTRPTVGGHRITVEPWILDFSGDLYGKTLTLEFYKFLRPEQKFSSLEELQAEIQKNAAQTREFFANF